MEICAGSGRVDPNEARSWEKLLGRAVREVFETAAGMALSPCADGVGDVQGQATAIIGMAGLIDGVLTVRCDEATACAISSRLPGTHEAGAPGGWDALGEICGMVARNFKGRLGEPGRGSVLSVPTVIHGQNFRVRPMISGAIAECRMWTGSGILSFRLDYRL